MEKLISNIVFTKNRPLQLHAYLESLYRYFPADLIQTYVLWKVEHFTQQYKQLFHKYPDCAVIRENDFHNDFVNLINEIETKYILFGIDDVVYFDGVEFSVIDNLFNRHKDDIFGFSLRFGKESLKGTGDQISETTATGQSVYSLDWTKGQTPATRYPFELCATIYCAELVKKIIASSASNNSLSRILFKPKSPLIKSAGKVISTRSLLKKFGFFYNPNTLESWNCRWCQNHDSRLPAFIYFQKQCAAAVQVNMVNTSTVNLTNGTARHTVEVLAERYKQGYRLDIDFIAKNKPAETHCGQEWFKLVR